MKHAVGLFLVVLLPGSLMAGPGVQLGVSAGASLVDDGLRARGWEPSPGWNAALTGLARIDGWGAGLRVSNLATGQALGLEGVGNPAVRLTAVEVLLRRDGPGVAGFLPWAAAGGGWAAVRYHPDSVTWSPGLGADPVEISLLGVNTWVGSVTGGIDRAVSGDTSLGLEIQGAWFPLDTAKSVDGGITEEREMFGAWSARLGISWTPRSL